MNSPESARKRGSSSAQIPTKQLSLPQSFSNQKRQKTDKAMAIDTRKSPLVNENRAMINNKDNVRKVVIKNFALKDNSKREAEFYEATFKRLDDALEMILAGKQLNGLHDLYKSCENVVRGAKAERCARLASDKMATQIQKTKKKLIQSIQDGDTAIDSVLEAWKSWQHKLSLIRSICFYLDRTYLMSDLNLSPLQETGTSLFRTELLLQSEIKEPFVTTFVAMFDRLRDGQTRSMQSDIFDAMQLLASTKLYDSLFEPFFLRATERYYIAISEASQKSSPTNFLATIERLLSGEAEIADTYLKPQTKPHAIDIVQQKLIAANVDFIIGAFNELIDARDVSTLGRMYKTLALVGETAKLRTAFTTYVGQAGLAILADTSNDKSMVESLITFKASMDEVLLKSFDSEDLFSKALRDQFASFINSRGDVPAEMMAKYIDSVLRSGNKKFNEDDLEIQMTRLMDIFRFIASKDVFEAFYKKDLAKRLLLNKSASSDAETSLLKKLRVECGPQFTSKLEGMFKDIDISREYNRTLPGSQLEVMILSQGAWPTYPEVKVQLPENMSSVLDEYQAHYHKSHSGRKLMWRHTLGQCQIKAVFPKGDKELSVSLFQGIVLLLFNADQTLSYKDIQIRTGLDDKELIRTMQSLACGKAETRVLLKHPKGKDVLDTDTFKINDLFQNPKKMVKINQIQMKETAEENKATHARVIQDRSFEIQAAIIRIMKSAKRKTHAELIASTIDTIKGRGIPQIGDIKAAISKLLDREYISRHEKEYHYEA